MRQPGDEAKGRRPIAPVVWRLAVAMVWIASAVLAAGTSAGAQPPASGPLTYRALVALLNGGAADARVRDVVAQRGCAAPVTSDEERGLRALGVSGEMLQFLMARCGRVPGQPAPAVAPSAESPTASVAALFGADQFVRIEPGTFRMGNDWDRGAGPAHEVRVTRPFLLQKTEVTQAQWAAVMGTNPSFNKACGPRCPVESVTWDDIRTFLERLNAMDPGKEYRLPTEAEWEYAALAGATVDTAFIAELLTTLNDVAWHKENSAGQTHPVAGKRPNAWGLFDMSGNVLERVQDRYDNAYYRTSPREDPQGPAEGGTTVARGGAWNWTPNRNFVQLRVSIDPSTAIGNVGLRLARGM